MAKPYSMDLRARAISRVEAGQSVRMVADALSVAPSSVVKRCQPFDGALGQFGHSGHSLIMSGPSELLEAL